MKCTVGLAMVAGAVEAPDEQLAGAGKRVGTGVPGNARHHVPGMVRTDPQGIC